MARSAFWRRLSLAALLASLIPALPVPAPDLISIASAANGEKIAFTSERDGNAEIYVMNTDGSGQTNLTKYTAAHDIDPTWSPDGKRIAFMSNRDGDYEIYVMDANGGSQQNLTNDHRGDDLWPNWSPDGRKIAFTSMRDGNQEVYVLDVSNPKDSQRNLTKNSANDHSPNWSSDNTQIAFASNRDGDDDIFVMSADGQNQRKLVPHPREHDYSPAWSPDGQRLAYTSHLNGLGEIYIVNSNGSNSKNLTQTPTNHDFKPTWSPDGQYIAFGSSNGSGLDIYMFKIADPKRVVRLTIAAGADYFPDWSPPLTGDSDGDGLLDDWEINGYAICTTFSCLNGNSPPPFVDLPNMGADPYRPDIFIQVDWMEDSGHSHKISPSAIRALVRAFDSSPYRSPTGSVGINLHVDQGPDSILDFSTNKTWGALSRARKIDFVNPLGTCQDDEYDWSSFQAIKDVQLTDTGRSISFHYVVTAHDIACQGVLGISRNNLSEFEQGASDFIISLGSDKDRDTVGFQAGVFMHELGHNLGLKHAGNDHVPMMKPNYLSVMNYLFLTETIGVMKGTGIDYSRATSNLNENALDESVGLGPQARGYGTLHFCSLLFGAVKFWEPVTDATQPIDWNCNGEIDTKPVSYDINGDGEKKLLLGSSDWQSPPFTFKGGVIGRLELEVPLPTKTPAEPLTREMIDVVVAENHDSDGDGFPDGLDTCPNLTNPSQDARCEGQPPLPPSIVRDTFQRTWSRTDQPIAEQQVSRTWMWGPHANTGERIEPYAESPGEERVVQYFDKSRMEITHPDQDPNLLWYVTNGLLAKELVTGQMQVGDNSFEPHQPAQVHVAGDPDPSAPTYATFNGLMGYSPIPTGWTITQTVNRAGEVGNDEALASFGVSAVDVGAPTNHTVASVFWDFMNSSGLVYQDGQYVVDRLFENPFYATGYPLTEAYWTTVKVGGVEKRVLVQVFERRVLTYTPDNPDGWKVEAGNVGQHYYAWRYG